jgi:CRP-like cAMP-binding protein
MQTVSNYPQLTSSSYATSLSIIQSPGREYSNSVPSEDALNLMYSFIIRCTGIELSSDDKSDLREAFKSKSLRRRQYLMQEGEVCHNFSFIATGALRMFSVNERGQEAILSLNTECSWLTDEESLHFQKPSRYNIDALENTVVLQVTLPRLQLLIHNISAVAEMIARCRHEQVIDTQRRLHAAISMTTEEQYQDLLENKPDYAQRFSQNLLAAYLGVKAETLSRVRKR